MMKIKYVDVIKTGRDRHALTMLVHVPVFVIAAPVRPLPNVVFALKIPSLNLKVLVPAPMNGRASYVIGTSASVTQYAKIAAALVSTTAIAV